MKNQITQKDTIEAMKSIAKFINDALELTKSKNPNSYDEEVFQELSEQCITVLTHLKQESE